MQLVKMSPFQASMLVLELEQLLVEMKAELMVPRLAFQKHKLETELAIQLEELLAELLGWVLPFLEGTLAPM